MGVELNWNIESESGRQKHKQNDPEEQRASWRAFRRLILGILILIGGVALVVYLISRRSVQIDTAIENQLRNTVDAEIAALRIGDEAAFLALQRSAAPEWAINQQITFMRYQSEKMSTDLQLSGRIESVLIDKQRARVQVEEIQNGTPYLRTWFYWRYDDEIKVDSSGQTLTIEGGWRHVPPDYTFWGESQSISTERFTLQYGAVDAPFAQALADALTDWLTLSCEALPCADVPPLQVRIVPGQTNNAAWENTKDWQLIVRSPYADKARSDQPLETPQKSDIGTLLATRLVDQTLGGRQIVFPSDASYLRGAVVTWLVGRYVQTDTESSLIRSLAQTHGADKVGQLLQRLQPESDMRVLNELLGVPLDQAGLDWRDFLTWRLATEDSLIQQRAETLWQKLVDLSTEPERNAAYARYNAAQASPPRKVSSVSAAFAPDGTPLLIALVTTTDGSSEQITFRLVNQVWLRVG